MLLRTLGGLLAVCMALPLVAQDWQVGLARAKITPEEPIRMAGYASRTTPSESVSTDLWAKAIAFLDDRGNRAVLITADTLGFPKEVVEGVCGRIGESNGCRAIGHSGERLAHARRAAAHGTRQLQRERR